MNFYFFDFNYFCHFFFFGGGGGGGGGGGFKEN